MASFSLTFTPPITALPSLRRIVSHREPRRVPVAVLQEQPKSASLPQDTTDKKSRSPRLAPDQKPVQEAADSGYSWTEQWYPIAFEDDIIDGTPMSVPLFDKELVLFRSGSGYSVLNDVCSHRLASLSEGRIVDGIGEECKSIECPYHGWTFADDGECTRIPQLTDPDPTASIPHSAHTYAYPTAVALGTVFVWFGEPSRADSKQLPVPEIDFSRDVILGAGFTRIVPYSFETLGENLSDPAHLQFAHHGTNPTANRGMPFGGNFEHSLSVRKNSEGSWTATYGKHVSSQIPRPNVIWVSTNQKGIGELLQLLMFSPVGRRRARLMIFTIVEKPTLMAKILFKWRPRWMSHQESLTFLDSDATVLVNLERSLGDPRSWRKRYGPPAGKCDKLVIMYRRFMDKYRDDMPWESAEPDYSRDPGRMSKADVLERLHAHTALCTSCSGALHKFERVRKILHIVKLFLGFVLVCVGFTGTLVDRCLIGAAATPLLVKMGVTCAVLFAASMLIDKWSEKCVEGFVYSEEAKNKVLNVKEFKRK